MDVFWWESVPGVPGRQGKSTLGVLQEGRELGCHPLGVDSSWGKDSSRGGCKDTSSQRGRLRPGEYFYFNFVGTERPDLPQIREAVKRKISTKAAMQLSAPFKFGMPSQVVSRPTSPLLTFTDIYPGSSSPEGRCADVYH